ncbi:MAG: tRNA 2-thiouridine(34) synthase MnmA [Bacteroidales bacterium]|jgi:tRNA-specific 2-thiouridylase
MSKHGRILVAMSGGVDSSVASILLKEEGYEVIGITLKTWDYSLSGCEKKENACCNTDAINDARSIAVKSGFPHYVIDLTQKFNDCVIENFVDEYLSGRTPNPCILCNTNIKWATLLEKANQLGCEYVATGHYAKVNSADNRYFISKATDDNKDQSYVLWALTQEQLKKTMFPLGKYKKPEIKSIATKFGFTDIAGKRESYEICFIPDDDYRTYLKNIKPEIAEKLNGGNFVNTDRKIIGKHKGFPFYTIGQRKGLEVAVGTPLYVVEIIPETNTVVLGFREELSKKKMSVENYNLMKYSEINSVREVITKVRYKDKGTLSRIVESENKINVEFLESVAAIAPGQSAVFYENDDIVGGGFIAKD